MDELQLRTIECGIEITKAVQDAVTGDWLISGPVGSLKKDHDGETLTKASLVHGLDTFFNLGANVDVGHKWETTGDLKYIIGKGIAKGEVDGKPEITVKLLKSKPEAQGVWDHVTACVKAGENPGGFSIYGVASERNKKDPNVIEKTLIHSVTYDPRPKGYDQSIRIGPSMGAATLAKSLGLDMAVVESLFKAMPLKVQELDPNPIFTDPENAEAGDKKVAKAEVNFREAKAERHSCGHCSSYGGGKCERVEGSVHPDDLCDLFEPLTRKSLEKAYQEARKKCPQCGGSMYCVTCHNKAAASDGVSKAFAGPNDSWPIDTEKHIHAALSYYNAGKGRKSHSDEEWHEIGNKIASAATAHYGSKHSLQGDNIVNEDAIEKAETTGEGVVQAGDTGGRALRTQELKERKPLDSATFCPECKIKLTADDKEVGKCHKCNHLLKKASPILIRLQQLGVTDPDAVVKAITAQSRR